MNKELNLLESFPVIKRDISSRKANKEINRKLALKFSKEYFDGTREQGYGGYNYDGRWVKVATRIKEIFSLSDGDNFLDVGCAKGYLMYDIKKLFPKINVYGVDVSKYAKSCADKLISKNISISNCKKLNYDDSFFKCVISINTVHNLERNDCFDSIKEIQRVSGGKAFIQVDAYRNENDLELFKDWMLTAKTYLKPQEWIDMFDKAGYTGYYYWTILEN